MAVLGIVSSATAISQFVSNPNSEENKNKKMEIISINYVLPLSVFLRFGRSFSSMELGALKYKDFVLPSIIACNPGFFIWKIKILF